MKTKVGNELKEALNTKVLIGIRQYAHNNLWHKVNDYPKTSKTKIAHEVYITPEGNVIAFGIDADNTVLVWNKAF